MCIRDRGALEIVDGLYVGGCLKDAQKRVARGEAAADDLAFFSGYAAWPIETLNEEIAAGTWRVVAASAKVVAAAAAAVDGEEGRRAVVAAAALGA